MFEWVFVAIVNKALLVYFNLLKIAILTNMCEVDYESLEIKGNDCLDYSEL